MPILVLIANAGHPSFAATATSASGLLRAMAISVRTAGLQQVIRHVASRLKGFKFVIAER